MAEVWPKILNRKNTEEGEARGERGEEERKEEKRKEKKERKKDVYIEGGRREREFGSTSHVRGGEREKMA